MKAIWKYPLPVSVSFPLLLPKGAEVLSVQVQGGHPLNNQAVLWAFVDTELPKVMRKFSIFATGEEVEESDDLEYVGTWQSKGFVWHLFEVMPA